MNISPELISRFRAYHQVESAWGSLHIVLDDDNYNDRSVDFCLEYALKNGDVEGYELAVILRQLSVTQRKKLATKA